VSDLVICIRHGEKPINAEHKHEQVPPDDKDGPGFDVHGHENRHSLTIRGWQRAGALAATDLCRQLAGEHVVKPATFLVPQYLDEGTPCDDTAIHRPYQTVLQLARKTNAWPTSVGPADNTDRLHEHIATYSGTVVVCWEHKQLQKLRGLLVGDRAPTAWPDEAFDLIWRFHRAAGDAKGTYRFDELEQKLLSTDGCHPGA
jgi:hypothetical protein